VLVRYEAGLTRTFERALKQLTQLQSPPRPGAVKHVGSFRKSARGGLAKGGLTRISPRSAKGGLTRISPPSAKGGLTRISPPLRNCGSVPLLPTEPTSPSSTPPLEEARPPFARIGV
jgi:hypothetical protein